MHEFEHERGSIVTYSPEPGVLCSEVSGHLTEAAAECIIAMRERLIPQHASLVEFHDWEAMTGYDSASRRKLTEHSVLHRGAIRRITIHTVALMVKMGIAAAQSRMPGVIRIAPNRLAFESEHPERRRGSRFEN